jgi:hypothetical protein
VKTKEKGWGSVFLLISATKNLTMFVSGVFAGEQMIPANTFLGIYAGEYLTDDVGEERGMFVIYSLLQAQC